MVEDAGSQRPLRSRVQRDRTAFVGPAMVAAATDMAGSQRIGLATVIGLFVAGFTLLLTVQDPRPAAEGSLRAARAEKPRARASVRRLCPEK
jgi:hypothetical protein